ncbi:unnamed protein product [Adineta ricciae]|uniref:Uncharacterized protein n=1 Tax=Adineta ricciae TaxID=249248 RepID=A0A815M370_ADIRI|nr:unnamed protein product [Adineta ricciae]
MDSVQLSQQMKQFRLYLRPIINTLNKCLQLSSAFQASANRFFCEDTHRIATLILECSYYQYDLESTLTRRNFDYQKHITNEIKHEIDRILSSITTIVDLHLHWN